LEPSLLTNGSNHQSTILPSVQTTLVVVASSQLNQTTTTNPTIVSNVPTVTQPLFVANHMQTRSKSGIFKPKVTYAAQVDYANTEPTSHTHSSKHS
jgi:hypothetical protein